MKRELIGDHHFQMIGNPYRLQPIACGTNTKTVQQFTTPDQTNLFSAQLPLPEPRI